MRASVETRSKWELLQTIRVFAVLLLGYLMMAGCATVGRPPVQTELEEEEEEGGFEWWEFQDLDLNRPWSGSDEPKVPQKQ
jgi:hypothetical protein